MKVREMTNALKIEQRNVATLVPYAANSRTHTDTQIAQIAASIKEFGWTNPILIDGKDTIIAGHARTLAAQKLGIKDVPVIVLDYLSEAQQRALVIADNQLAVNAGWDYEILAIELGEIKDLGFDIDLIGFSAGEIAKLTFEEKDLYPDSSAKEINPDDYNMGHQCPKCGFEFNDDK
jgi:ParB-like chromosome segregation protein Spo0J